MHLICMHFRQKKKKIRFKSALECFASVNGHLKTAIKKYSRKSEFCTLLANRNSAVDV